MDAIDHEVLDEITEVLLDEPDLKGVSRQGAAIEFYDSVRCRWYQVVIIESVTDNS